MKKDKIKQAIEMISKSKRVVFFTGAGACVDSGLPDFRGIGSVYWDGYTLKDCTYQKYLNSEETRREYWRMDQDFYELVKTIEPNPVHYVIAELERIGKTHAVVTQNVDGMHQKAGIHPEKVIEIHGSIFTVSCLACYKRFSRDDIYNAIKSGISVPYCTFCHGILKPETILFGQPIPEHIANRALAVSLQSDLFISIGSSLLVQPASYLILKAKWNGAKIIIINLTATPYDREADIVIYANAAKTMSRIGEQFLP